MTGSASANVILKFEKHHFKSCLPVAIHADFEAMNINLQTASLSDKQPYILLIFLSKELTVLVFTLNLIIIT